MVSESRDGAAMVARFASTIEVSFRKGKETGKEKKENRTEFRRRDRKSLAREEKRLITFH